MIRKDGEVIWINNYSRPIQYQGKPANFITVFDITELKLKEENLRFLSTIVEQVTDSVIVTNRKFEIIYINKANEKLYGYKSSELIGKSPEILNADLKLNELKKEIIKVVKLGKEWNGSGINKRKDGSKFICEFKVSPLVDENEQITGYVSIQRDITGRK